MNKSKWGKKIEWADKYYWVSKPVKFTYTWWKFQISRVNNHRCKGLQYPSVNYLYIKFFNLSVSYHFNKTEVIMVDTEKWSKS